MASYQYFKYGLMVRLPKKPDPVPVPPPLIPPVPPGYPEPPPPDYDPNPPYDPGGPGGGGMGREKADFIFKTAFVGKIGPENFLGHEFGPISTGFKPVLVSVKGNHPTEPTTYEGSKTFIDLTNNNSNVWDFPNYESRAVVNISQIEGWDIRNIHLSHKMIGEVEFPFEYNFATIGNKYFGTIDFSHNDLETINLESHIRHVDSLNLSYNPNLQYAYIPHGVINLMINDCPQLKMLNLSNCQIISYLYMDRCSNLGMSKGVMLPRWGGSGLSEIYCSDCNLTELTHIEYQHNLRVLSARNNNIRTIDMTNCQMLFQVDLDGNPLDDVKISPHTHMLTLGYNTNLTQLDVSQCMNLTDLSFNTQQPNVDIYVNQQQKEMLDQGQMMSWHLPSNHTIHVR